MQVDASVHLPNLEKVIPYVRARDLILQNPDHIAVLDCPCHQTLEVPCLPLDVCLIVGELFAEFVIEHHPHHARWISPQEALAILAAEDERGHVHHAYFKDAMLGHFYAICNCCSCRYVNGHDRSQPMHCCGVCVNHGDQGALALVRETSKGEPLEILNLIEGTSK